MAKVTTTEMRKLAVEYMRQRNRMNQYTQGQKRIYFFGDPDNQPGNTTQAGFSDCSSSVRAAIKAAAGIDIGGNTDQQIRNRGRGIIVQEPEGVPNEKLLLLGDCLYFRGNDAHIMGVGHVEMYAGDGKIVGHGGGMGPYESDMKTYCKKRPCFMVIRWIVDEDRLDPNLQKHTIQFGDCGDLVREMQVILISLGYDLGKWGADGEFGSATRKAVEKFQEDHSLIVDGKVGEETWNAFDKCSILGSGKIKIVGGNCWVRSAPESSGKRLGVAKEGDVFDWGFVTAENGWQLIAYKNQNGWVSGRYGKLVE